MNDRIKSLPLGNVTITDSFWSGYTRLVREVIIPYQWEALNDRVEGAEQSFCLRNFRIAAGLEQGEHHGAVFQDTDVAKWLEAVAYSIETHPDPQLESAADGVIELIAGAQWEDGYINTYFTLIAPERRWKNLTEGHELYTAGHLIEAAVAYYHATGKRRFLDVMVRFADLICDVFGEGEGQIHGYPGHQEIELALVKLYRVTGERRYLDTAKYFIDRRGHKPNYFKEEIQRQDFKSIFGELKDYDPAYSQSHLPVREQESAVGHAVRAMYMYCAMADIAWEYREEELMRACAGLWKNITQKRMYITGSVGSSAFLERFTTDYDLPNDFNYSETCASIGLALFGLRMARMNRDASYMDVVESALYNTILSGISSSGMEFFYVNPLEVWPASCMEHTSRQHVKPVRQKWFGCACCPPNITRTLASLGQYIYGADDRTLYIDLFIAGSAKLELEGQPVTVLLETEFPWKPGFKAHMSLEGGSPVGLALRIPAWAEDYTIRLNGQAVADYRVEKGYAMLEIQAGESTVEVDFSMDAKLVYSHPAVRANVNRMAIVRGPMVYCLEEEDNGDRLCDILVEEGAQLEEQYEPQLLGGIMTVTAPAYRIADDGWEGKLYASIPMQLEPVVLKAVPYCCWGNRRPGEMLVWVRKK